VVQLVPKNAERNQNFAFNRVKKDAFVRKDTVWMKGANVSQVAERMRYLIHVVLVVLKNAENRHQNFVTRDVNKDAFVRKDTVWMQGATALPLIDHVDGIRNIVLVVPHVRKDVVILINLVLKYVKRDAFVNRVIVWE